jgi:DnaK suppressor protein
MYLISPLRSVFAQVEVMKMRILEIAMDREHFKQRLLDKERELVAEMARLEDEARDSGEAEVRDSTDDATSSQSTSEALQEDALASQTLTQVRDALKRIDDGTYGSCIACGRQVEAARLEAVPWAAYCLEDQEKQDKTAQAPQGGSTH